MRAQRLRPLFLCVPLVFFSLYACSTNVPAENPFDPEGGGIKAPGRLQGTVFVQGSDGQDGHVVRIYDSAATESDSLSTDTGGGFLSSELSPGVYRVEISTPVGNVPIRVDNVEVLPGLTTELGLLTSLTEPPVGSIIGTVELQDTAESPQGVRVVATRLSGEISQSWVAFSDPSGAYFFNQLPAGQFEVLAEHEGFTPDVVDVLIDGESPTRALATAVAMNLYPASAVMHFVVENSEGILLPSAYTNGNGADESGTVDGSVRLELLAFGAVNQMRISESIDFDAGNQPWRNHEAQVSLALGGGEGLKTVYAQFRRFDDADQREILRTPSYQTSIVFDETAPTIVSFVIDPGATLVGGSRYLRANSDAVPIELSAYDAHSRVAGYKLVIEGVDPGAFIPLVAGGPSISIATLATLSGGDGEKTIDLLLLDRAGNISAPIARSVLVDTTAPALLADPAVSVRNANGSELNTTAITLQFAVGENLGAGVDGPVRMRYGQGPVVASGSMGVFLPQANLLVDAEHDDIISFYGVFEDAAGNTVGAESIAYRLNLRGSIAGKIDIESIDGAKPPLNGVTARVFRISDDANSAIPVGSADANNDGSFVVTDIPEGTYQLLYRGNDTADVLRAPLVVSAGQTTQLGLQFLNLARGEIVAVFGYGDLDASANQGGITVTASINGAVKASGVTDETGAVRLTEIPTTSGSLFYVIQATADGYITSRLEGVSVDKDEVVNLNDGPPYNGEAIGLAKLSGDFKICLTGGVGLPRDCTPILYTNASAVLLGLTADVGQRIRYVVEDPSATDPFPDPDTECTPSVQGCWEAYTPDNPYVVDLSSSNEGRLNILAQIEVDGVEQPVGNSQVILDRSPPTSPALTIQQGVVALLQGYTDDNELAIDGSAFAGGVDVAPVAIMRLSRDNSWDGHGNSGDSQYTFGGTKLFTVATGDGQKTVFAWFCDAASNCTLNAVSDSIILDTQPPARSNGRDIVPVADWVVERSAIDREWWSRSARYDIRIDLGTSSQGISEVAAYRLSLNEQFVGAAWNDLAPDVVTGRAGGTGFVSTSGVELPPVDGQHAIWAQFRDAAGNETEAGDIALDRFDLFLDTTPPGGTVMLANGVAFTALNPIAVALTTDASGGATETQSTWTGVLPDPYADARQIYQAGFDSAAPLGDGNRTLLVRFFDAAGNFGERQATTFLDQTPPDDSAIALCDSCSTGDSGTLYFNDGNGLITLFLFANDNSGVIDRINVSVDSGSALPQSYAPYASVTVSSVEGPHTVAVAFVDPAGNSRSLAPLTLVHDRVDPSANLSINGGAALSGDANVALNITASDNGELAGMYVSNSSTFSDAVVLPFSSTLDWTLGTPGSDGNKRVYVRVVDAAGNSFDTDDDIDYDGTPPANTSLDLGVGQWTTSTSLSASLSAIGATAFYIDGDVDDTTDTFDWVSFKATADISLTFGDGPKTVWVRYRDAAGNESTAISDFTFLDQTPPTMTSARLLGRHVNGTVDQTTTALLDISVEIVGADASLLAISTSGTIDCGTATYDRPFANSVSLTITNAGQVHLCAKDDAGNITGPLNDSIVVDQTPPSCSVTLRGYRADGTQVSPGINNSFTALTTIDVLSSCSGQPVAIAAVPGTQSLDCSTASYQTYSSNVPVNLPAGDGTKNVNMCYRDAVGNAIANPISAAGDLILDTQAPSGNAVFLARNNEAIEATHTNTRSVDAFVSSTDATQMRVSGLPSAGSWTNFSTSAVSLVLASYGAGGETCGSFPSGANRRVYAQLRDDLRNTSSFVTDEIAYDPCPPAAPTVVLQSAPGANGDFADDRAVNAALSNINFADRMRIIGRNNASCPSMGNQPISDLTPTAIVNFSSDGLKRVCVALEDLAGNISSTGQDTIRVDTQRPAAPSLNPGNTVDANYACAAVSKTAESSIDTNFWKWQGRQNGSQWQDLPACSGSNRPCVNGTGKAEFELLQDTDNTLELRAVDDAGNLGFANSAYVEEVSSYLYPTYLTVKQVCDNGNYVIMRDEAVWPAARTICFAGDGGHYTSQPEIGLFNMNSLSYQRFNGDGGLAAALEPGYIGNAQFRTAWDAACEPTQSQLIFPYFPVNQTAVGFGNESLYAVWQDPYGGGAFSDVVSEGIGPAGLWYVPGSIDVVNFDTVTGATWDEFDALAVNQNWSTACGGNFGIEKLFQVRNQAIFEDDTLYASSVAGEFDVDIRTYTQEKRWLYGLAMNSSSSTFMHYYPQAGTPYWRVRRATNWGTVISGSLSFYRPTDATLFAWGGFDENNSPYNRLARAAQFRHQTYFFFGLLFRNEPYQQHVHLTRFGDTTSYRVSDANYEEIGNNSTWYMPSFEAGNNRTGWIDLNETNVIRIGQAGQTLGNANSTYGSPDEIYEYRYSIDTRRPLFSAMKTGAGEPLVIYHTGGFGSTEGVVVGFRDQTGCLGD